MGNETENENPQGNNCNEKETEIEGQNKVSLFQFEFSCQNLVPENSNLNIRAQKNKISFTSKHVEFSRQKISN